MTFRELEDWYDWLDNHRGWVIGDLDKPFHLPECACQRCEEWRRRDGRPTREELRRRKSA